MTFEYLTPAIVTSKYTGRLAFANNYLVGGIQLEFEDGTAIPSDYRWEILEISERYAIPIQWSRGRGDDRQQPGHARPPQVPGYNA